MENNSQAADEATTPIVYPSEVTCEHCDTTFLLTEYMKTREVLYCEKCGKEIIITGDEEKKSKAFDVRPLSLRVALIAITAALYTALGYIFLPISFLGIQFRVAEK